MHNPAHPGELLSGWLDDLNMSTVHRVLHAVGLRLSVTPEPVH
jgi:hypothetical protein